MGEDGIPSEQTVRALVYGWGNTKWAADPAYIRTFMQYARQAANDILECGSGLSTLLLGLAARDTDVRVWSLEHDAEWADRMESLLARYGIDTVTVCSSPLCDFGDFEWYDAPLDRLPKRFDVVVCDGPPYTTRGGRYGLVPVFGSRLCPGTVILLHDAQRRQEQNIAATWARQLGTDFTVSEACEAKCFATIVV